MTPRHSPHSLFPTLYPFVVIALAVSAPFAFPISAADEPGQTIAPARPSVANPLKPPSPFRRPADRYPDPRYRQPANFTELQSVAAKVSVASGLKSRWRLALGEDPGPLARIRSGVDDSTIYLHPVGARKVPPNTWAFIFGHEFAHRVERLGAHSQTSPANELKADIAGARYAMAAGYRLEAFLGWVLTEPNQSTSSHGTLHQRVRSIAAHFRIPQTVIQAEAKRYQTYRAESQAAR